VLAQEQRQQAAAMEQQQVAVMGVQDRGLEGLELVGMVEVLAFLEAMVFLVWQRVLVELLAMQ